MCWLLGALIQTIKILVKCSLCALCFVCLLNVRCSGCLAMVKHTVVINDFYRFILGLCLMCVSYVFFMCYF